jgi:predicted DNA-binding protein
MSAMKTLNIRIPEDELEILKQYAEQTNRTQTEIVRAYIRSLKDRIKDKSEYRSGGSTSEV